MGQPEWVDMGPLPFLILGNLLPRLPSTRPHAFGRKSLDVIYVQASCEAVHPLLLFLLSSRKTSFYPQTPFFPRVCFHGGDSTGSRHRPRIPCRGKRTLRGCVFPPPLPLPPTPLPFLPSDRAGELASPPAPLTAGLIEAKAKA